MAIKEYLDTVGAKHIVDTVKGLVRGIDLTHNHDGVYQPTGDYVTEEELTDKAYATKVYVDNAVTEAVTGGTVDLSNYYSKDETYNKEEVNALIPTVSDGVDGVSPTVTVIKVDGVATITCTDVNGTTTETISDGVSPTIDMSNYYTKAEVEALIAGITNGGTDTGDGGTTEETETPTTGGTTSITGGTTIRIGRSKSWTGKFLDSEGTEVEGLVGTWTVVSAFDDSFTTKTIADNKITLVVDNEDLLDETFTLKFEDSTGAYTASELEVSIVEAF